MREINKIWYECKTVFRHDDLFIVIGIAFEIMIMLGINNAFRIDFGALFLYCAAMYPAQTLMTLDISGMVQASSYKKMIQTSAMSFVSLCGNLVALAILLLVRMMGTCIMPERADQIWSGLLAVGIMGLGLSIMGALMYKFYILSIIVLTVVYGSIMASQNIMGMEAAPDILSGMSLPGAIAFCIAMILLGNGIQYLITRMIYKRPYSKGAFGNAVGKKFV